MLNYAHQGGAREGPSSTLHAIRSALRAGATAIELDVHATADRHLVVCHDETVDRTTDGSGAIASMTLEALRRLDNAHWWAPGEVVAPDAAEWPLRGQAPADRSLGVATLDEALEEFPGVIINLDIKQTAPDVEPYEALLADTLRRHGRTGDVIVASFIDRATDAFAELAPDIPTSVGTNGTAAFYFAVMAGDAPPPTRHVALQVPPEFEGTPIVTERFVDAAHRHGLAVHVWTIDDEADMERLVDIGVDGIITDRPSLCTAVLARRGLAYRP